MVILLFLLNYVKLYLLLKFHLTFFQKNYFTDFINGLIPYKAAFLITFISTVFVTWIVSWGIYIVLEKKILKKIYLLMGWN